MAENREIERKFLLKSLPEDLDRYASYEIEQAYLCSNPTVRVRKGGEKYTMTYKSGGGMDHAEYNLPLDAASYAHLLEKCDGRVITKRRYKIPYGRLLIELDIFSGCMEGLILAEVEFDSVEEANAFEMPDWFSEDVTADPKYRNVEMALGNSWENGL